MTQSDGKQPKQIDCPSAQPEHEEARIYGVVAGEPGRPRVAFLTGTRPVTPDLLALAGDAKPTQIFRIAAPCANGGCLHFAEGACSLAQRVVAVMPPVVAGLPACQIRRSCRWFHQEGKAACFRCPQVITEPGNASDLDLAISGQPTPAPAAE
jgi:hypothetical protein